MARSFFLSKLWQEILTRLGLVETNQGNLPAPVDYNTITEIRAETTHVDEDRVFCLENQITYQYNDASTADDDGFAVLKPDNIDAGNPGRWLMEYQLALKTHTHTEKANVVTNPTQTKFLVSNSSGHPVESAYGSNSFAPADHNHDSAYATAADLAALAEDIETLTTALADKVDKPEISAGDVGKPAVINADRNVVPGSTIVFHQYSTGALTSGVLKACPHNKDLTSYIINVRSADNKTNAQAAVLEPTPAAPNNSVDILVYEDVAAPGLTIQILGV